MLGLKAILLVSRRISSLAMIDYDTQFLSFIDRCIEDDPSLVVPADEAQLKRLAKILGIARQGIEQYSEALSQLA